MATKAATPKGLGKKAAKRWRDFCAKYDLRLDELAVLEQSCRECDIIEKLQELIDDPAFEMLVTGSMGQDSINPVLNEIRQHRALDARLLKQLDLPEEGTPAQGTLPGITGGERSAGARNAAEARWGKRGA